MSSLTAIGSITSGKETAKPDTSIVRILAKKCCTFRALQGHTGGEMIEPEMMGHVCIPLNWKQFVFRRGCSIDLKSIVAAGLIAGRREGREKQTHSILHST